jgi:beta-glucosidase
MTHKRTTLLTLILTLLLIVAVYAHSDTPAYLDPSLPVEERVADLLARMTLEEKIGQMTLVEKDSIYPPDIADRYIGGLLSGGGGYPTPNTPEAWAEMADGFQAYALQTRLAIPLIYGVDAVHGHGGVEGAVVFPHNIGLGAANNPELVEEIGRITAREMIATGIYWNFAPVVAVPQDIRWGRTYEGYSEDTDIVVDLSTAFIGGLQGERLGDPYTVLATPKHFAGDGGAVWGTSTTGDYQIDQGVTDVDEETLREIHLPPYEAAVENGAMSIMASFSSWGGKKMHAQEYLLTDVLKGELGFAGFVVSDWGGIDQITFDYDLAVITAINAGIDMNMVPYDYPRFIDSLTRAVEQGAVPMERIDDAVRRILRAKFQVGLFEHPFSDPSLLAEVGSEAHREVARQAVSESLVLLQNDNDALPIAPDTATIFVGGAFADDIGAQSGGWTIEWQGELGNITEGTTILEAIENAVSENTSVYYDRFGRFERITDDAGNLLNADVGIVVVGEEPYAEGVGDRANLHLPEPQLNLIARVGERVDKLVVIILSGRPMIITDELYLADAWVAAWLPGTEGQGVADVLFGLKPFTGRLSFSWPRSMEQLPAPIEDPLFPLGYGLTTDA